MNDAALHYAYRMGVVTAGVVTLLLYGGLWLAGGGPDEFVGLTFLLAFVSLSPGCLILGLSESGYDSLASASNAGVVIDGETRQRMGGSFGPLLVPFGFLLLGIGIQGILLTIFVNVLA